MSLVEVSLIPSDYTRIEKGKKIESVVFDRWLKKNQLSLNGNKVELILSTRTHGINESWEVATKNPYPKETYCVFVEYDKKNESVYLAGWVDSTLAAESGIPHPKGEIKASGYKRRKNELEFKIKELNDISTLIGILKTPAKRITSADIKQTIMETGIQVGLEEEIILRIKASEIEPIIDRILKARGLIS